MSYLSILSRVRFGHLSLIVIIFSLLQSFTQIYATTIKSITWEKSADSLNFFISTSSPVKFVTENHLLQKGYFSLELLNVAANYRPCTIEIGDPRLKRVEVAYVSDRVKFLFYSPTSIMFDVNYVEAVKNRLLVTIRTPVQKSLKPKVVIIDPGHGGESRGARSAYKIKGNYVWEKDIVLQIALKLKKLVDASPNLVAYLTRTEDNYVSLYERIKFAEKMKGDIFLSIHCNAIEGFRPTAARGIEIYYWSDSGTVGETNRFLEQLENDELFNAVDTTFNNHLKKILSNILKDELRQQTQASYYFCQILNNSLRKYPYFQKYNRGIKQARFKVLANYSMPAILIETGFLSNKDEARYLVDPSYQQLLAKAIFEALNNYFVSVDPAFGNPTFAAK